MRKLFLPLLGILFLVACNDNKPAETKETSVATAGETKETAAVEIADAKYMDIGKKGIAALSSGDIDGWMTSYADNAMYRWNNGDSAAGKAAISAYWKKRRTEVLDSISFSGDIWLPVKVNTPQQNVQLPGIWLLAWYKVDAKYKTGKKMTQWIHTDMHFDANDKIDLVIQYLDRALINEAMKK
ncbi:MAG: nuclear transport factor 2 family protein [Sphingobacteriales bacterium]|nr:nuclear transport factor 2 family protein [Sphingobacteriales bacterium]